MAAIPVNNMLLAAGWLLLATGAAADYAKILPDHIKRPTSLPDLCGKKRDHLTTPVHGREPIYRLAVTHSTHLKGHCRMADFEIKSDLGTGGYGTVALVKSKKTGELLAMKRFRSQSPLRFGLLRSEECHHYLATSAEAYGGAPVSPYITKFYCSMIVDNSVRLLMEYVEGETLMYVLTGGAKAAVRRRRKAQVMMRDIDLRRIWAQLVLAIEYLHDRGIVIGDLTSRNLMVTTSGNLKLIDFGFSKTMSNGHNDAPNFVNGPRQPAFSENPYIDWYAVGAILLEMLYAQKAGTNDGVRNPRDVRDSIKRERLLRMDCKELIQDKVACSLISKFVHGPWHEAWGMTQETRQAIRKHPYFKGFDWSSV